MSKATNNTRTSSHNKKPVITAQPGLVSRIDGIKRQMWIAAIANRENLLGHHILDAHAAALLAAFREFGEAVIGEDEQTPQAFKKWQNYTAGSPTVGEHYRNELRVIQRQRLEELAGGKDENM